MSPATIYLDMDGVIVDLMGAVFEMFGLDPWLTRQIATYDGVARAVSQLSEAHAGITNAQLWGEVSRCGYAFWHELDWTSYGRDIVRSCHAAGTRLVVLSKPLGGASYEGKRLWMAEHMPGVPILFGDHKHPCAHGPRTLLIDDCDQNLEEFRKAGGSPLIVPQPWNRCRSRIDSRLYDVECGIGRWADWVKYVDDRT